MSKNRKIVASAAAVVVALGLGAAAVGTTSSYFSDINSGGAITMWIGSIAVSVDGNRTTTPDLDLGSLLPGEVATGDFEVKNIGRNAQDVWLQFDPNHPTFKAVNQLGTYAEIEITVDGERVFFSDNLNGNYPPGTPGVTPLPSDLQLTEGLVPGDTATVEFSLKLSEKLQTQLPIAIPLSLPYSVVATQPGINPGA